MFPDRSGEIPFFKAKALAAWKHCEFDTARMHFFKFVESVKQQNVNTGGRLEAELHEAQGLYSRFVAEDPTYLKISEEVLRIVVAQPGLLQTDLYGRLPTVPRDTLSYVLYFAADHGRVVRTKKGRTYQLSLPVAPPARAEPDR